MNALPPEHKHRPIGHIDVLDVIIDICKDAKRYGTMLLLALMSEHHAAIVQPHLKRIRERVASDLDEFDFRDRSNDDNIEYVEFAYIFVTSR